MLIRRTLFPLDVRSTVGYTRGHAQRISVTVRLLEKPLAIPVTFTYTVKGVGGAPLAIFSSNLHPFHVTNVIPYQEGLSCGHLVESHFWKN